MKNYLQYIITIFFCLPFYLIQAQELNTKMWQPDGPVRAIIQKDSTIYLAGDFNYIGPLNCQNGAIIEQPEGKPSKHTTLRLNNNVTSSISDGKGGWYIGGLFTSVQGVGRKYVAHILASGQLDLNWNPNPNGKVDALVLFNNIVYVGGIFTSVGGKARRGLASLDATTGQVTSWNPDLGEGNVNALVVANNTLYVGGKFSSIAGQSRGSLAAFDIATGQITSWNPNVDSFANIIYTMAVSKDKVYVGGFFSSIGGQTRIYLAALDMITGQPTPWNPKVDSSIKTIALSGNSLYIGGYFREISGETRMNLAALDATSGQVLPWRADIRGGIINQLAADHNTVYIGGEFYDIKELPRKSFAAVDATTGQVKEWGSDANGEINTLAVFNNTVFLGGKFTSVGGKARRQLAALNATTGRATSWNPDLFEGDVNSLTVYKNTVYVGGNFKNIGGQPRSCLAAVDATTGQVLPWRADVDWIVHALGVSNNNLYVGGDFKNIGGVSRNNLAAIDATTGQVTAWNPNVISSLERMAIDNNTIYVGGGFSSRSGNLAAIDATTGQVTAWNPKAFAIIYNIILSHKTVYVVAEIQKIDGQLRKDVAAIDAITGKVTSWNASANIGGIINTLAVSNNTVYVGGSFPNMGGQPGKGLIAVDTINGRATGWQARVTGDINIISTYEDNIYIAGDLGAVEGAPFPYFAAFTKKNINTAQIKGTIFEDANGDCVKNPSEKGIANRAVVAQPGNYYSSTDTSGNYTIAVDTGSYTIQQIIPMSQEEFIRQICPKGSPFHIARLPEMNEIVTGKDFANQTIVKPYLSIGITSSHHRRCFASTTVVLYQNQGTADADSVKVYVRLPEHIRLVRADVSYQMDENKNYIFTIGKLMAGKEGSIHIKDSVICDNSNIRGLTQCTRAWITPANNRAPSSNWDQSDINLKATCLDNGRVRLAMHNVGNGSMADSSVFKIYLDTQLAFTSNFKLGKADSLILQVPANGQTVRLEADQRPEHPFRKQSFVTIEACGINSNDSVSKGYVSQQPQEEEEPEMATECLPIVDSFDPNDKAVSPQGIGNEHYTPTKKTLDYVIRFQNTGTDTAYKVVVIDTLSDYLDMSTLQVGTVSHPYKMAVTGKGKPVLTFTFYNINLPDSTKDQVGSNGHIQFSIQPKTTLPEKTIIENFADIFFDYNEPVRTNTVLNTIYDIPPVVVEMVKLNQSIICQTTNTTIQEGVNRSICEQDTVVMQAVSPSIEKGKWTLISGQGEIQDSEAATTLVKGLGYGENIFEWKVSSTTCADSLKGIVSIHRFQKPHKPVITQVGTDSLVCSITGESYRWQVDGVDMATNSKQIKANQPGKYAVSVKSPQGCVSDLSAPFFYVLTPTESYLSSLIKLYPNPTTGKIILILPADLGQKVEISLWDTIGRNIVRSKLFIDSNQSREVFDLSSEMSGVYLLKIQTYKYVILKRVIKK